MKKLMVAATTPLERKVKAWANREGQGYSKGGVEALRSLTEHGCESGMVGDLIYYTDTTKFYKRHKKEIQSILREMMSDIGIKSPGELFGDKWDSDDPFAEGDMNQNLLAWFGFEETARRLLDRAEGGGKRRHPGLGVKVAAHRRVRAKVTGHKRHWPDVLPDTPKKSRRGGKRRAASGAALVKAAKALKNIWR